MSSRDNRIIGLIAAMAQESRALLRRVPASKRIAAGPVFGFELGGWTCVLITSGMGARRAREAAGRLAETYAPQALVSFGIAGAVEADLEIGDVVAAEAFCVLEGGVPGPLLPLSAWPETARQAMQQAVAGRGARLFPGTAVTTGGAQLVQSAPGELVHPILEMETAGIAQAATEKGIPLLSLRAISDGPRAPNPVDLGEVMDENANLRAGRLLAALVRRPRVLLEVRQMSRNSRIAEDNAAIALVAALSQPDPGWPG
jgi:nucleoside phosphorylase